MLQLKKLIISNNAPIFKDAYWMKPVEGGYSLFTYKDGKWEPFYIINPVEETEN